MKIILKRLIFLKNFNNKEELDLDIKYKKNDKKSNTCKLFFRSKSYI